MMANRICRDCVWSEEREYNEIEGDGQPIRPGMMCRWFGSHVECDKDASDCPRYAVQRVFEFARARSAIANPQ